jgi:ankyrin repeat protein
MLSSKSSNLHRQVQNLESENADLKAQLMEAKAIIDSLKQENQALSKRIRTYKGNTIISSDSTFVTNKGSSSICDNCNQEVPERNLDLHFVQCLKRITRCISCNEPISAVELDNHIAAQKGSIEDMIIDIESGNIGRLDSRVAHGAELSIVDTNGNTLLHIAVKSGKREMVQYFLSKGLDINASNNFGETPLHLVCGRHKDFCMVQFLTTKGSDCMKPNSLGDSPMELAKRNGFLEAVIHFQKKSGNGRPGTSGSFNRINFIRSAQNEAKFEL